MTYEQQQIKKATGQVGAEIKNAQSSHLSEVMKRATKKGTTPKDALGLTDAMVEGIYGQAYRLFNTGKYKDAAQLFRLLLMINSTEPKYCMGLAASYHMMKEFKIAIDTYSILSVIESKNPIPFYHISDCLIQMNDPLAASMALEMTIKRAGDKPEYQTLKDRAKLTLESLKKEVKEKLAKG